jgi:hypothetical protein
MFNPSSQSSQFCDKNALVSKLALVSQTQQSQAFRLNTFVSCSQRDWAAWGTVAVPAMPPADAQLAGLGTSAHSRGRERW